MYKLVNDSKLGFDGAESACEKMHPDSNLVIIRDTLVWNWVNLTFYNNNKSYIWIGLNQTSQVSEPAGNWFWLDGSSDYTYVMTWRTLSSGVAIEPTNTFGNENCAEFSYGYNDDVCTYAYNFICEINGKLRDIQFQPSLSFLSQLLTAAQIVCQELMLTPVLDSVTFALLEKCPSNLVM
jgi:hypothetical protein